MDETALGTEDESKVVHNLGDQPPETIDVSYAGCLNLLPTVGMR